jgi:putative tryptophan/tyrosine transport system substrate-binding protein
MRRREFIAGLGGAVVWPLGVRAQQTTMSVIGFLDSNAAAPKAATLEALRAGLTDAGYVEGRNLTIEYRWADFNSRRLQEFAGDLVRRQVAAIVTFGSRGSILAARAATSTIPIIFNYAGDPVTDGLIASLARPGGNLTGVTSFGRDVAGKRLDLLLKTAPQATTIGFLSGTPEFISYEQQTSQMFTAAGALGVKLTVVECRSDRDFETAFAALIERRAKALILGTFPFRNLHKVVELAALHKIPGMYPYRGLAQTGGLMSYAADPVSLCHQVGRDYVGRVLNGEKAADLPVQLPSRYELVINLKTAKALGLTVPETLLATADEVIQ